MVADGLEGSVQLGFPLATVDALFGDFGEGEVGEGGGGERSEEEDDGGRDSDGK